MPPPAGQSAPSPSRNEAESVLCTRSSFRRSLGWLDGRSKADTGCWRKRRPAPHARLCALWVAFYAGRCRPKAEQAVPARTRLEADGEIVSWTERGTRMVLSDVTIRREIEAGRIGIDPLGPDAVQPASVNLRLGHALPRDEDLADFVPPAERTGGTPVWIQGGGQQVPGPGRSNAEQVPFELPRARVVAPVRLPCATPPRRPSPPAEPSFRAPRSVGRRASSGG